MGASSCEECVPGQYNVETGAEACELCPIGTYVAISGKRCCICKLSLVFRRDILVCGINPIAFSPSTRKYGYKCSRPAMQLNRFSANAFSYIWIFLYCSNGRTHIYIRPPYSLDIRRDVTEIH